MDLIQLTQLTDLTQEYRSNQCVGQFVEDVNWELGSIIKLAKADVDNV